jgi:hypothetical protein
VAERSDRSGLALLGFGAAACAACCAGPVIAFLAAAGIGMALFGMIGLAVAAIAVLVYLRLRSRRHAAVVDVPVALGRRPHA